MNHKLKYLAISFFCLFALGFVCINNIVPYIILQPRKITSTIKPDDFELSNRSISIRTHDSLLLSGYWIFTELDTPKAVIIMIHGISGHKESFLPICKQFASAGYASLIFDGRAHGSSEGRYCTYGHYEKRDVSAAVDSAKSKYPDIQIGVLGNSLGGAIALQALANDKRIDFGIIESTFTDLEQIVSDYQKRKMFGVRLRPISDYALFRAGKTGKFDPQKVRPIVFATNIKQPVLIAHGSADKNISVEYGKVLYQHLASENKKLIIVDGAGHHNLHINEGKYMKQILEFISKINM